MNIFNPTVLPPVPVVVPVIFRANDVANASVTAGDKTTDKTHSTGGVRRLRVGNPVGVRSH